MFDCTHFSRRILQMSVWPQVAAACKGVQFSVSRAFTSAPNSTKTNGLGYTNRPISRTKHFLIEQTFDQVFEVVNTTLMQGCETIVVALIRVYTLGEKLADWNQEWIIDPT